MKVVVFHNSFDADYHMHSVVTLYLYFSGSELIWHTASPSSSSHQTIQISTFSAHMCVYFFYTFYTLQSHPFR